MEANMLATSKKIESAFMFADQALEFATGRRLQTFEGHEKVNYTYLLPVFTIANAVSRHRQHDTTRGFDDSEYTAPTLL